MDNIKSLMSVDYSYPEQTDKNIQQYIYKKREFYGHKMNDRPNITNYDTVKEYRDDICGAKSFSLLEHQQLLSNFINPDTPYKGLLVFHGTGTGKCQLPDSLIYVNGNVKPIESLWNDSTDKIMVDSEGGEWKNPLQDLYVNSLYGNKIVPSKISKLYRQNIKEFMRKIELSNGTNISITMAHPLLVGSKWTNMLEIGDKIGVPYVLHNRTPIKCSIISAEDVAYEIFTCRNNPSYQIPQDFMNAPLIDIENMLEKLFILYDYGVTNNLEHRSKIVIMQLYHLLLLLNILCHVIIDGTHCFLRVLDVSDSPTNDVKFVNVTNITNFEYNGYVYDLEIDETHNYVSNGILCHNTCATIAVAEKFKSQVQKYGTKIYVLVSGPLNKETWKNELLKCTGETYSKYIDKNVYLNEQEKIKLQKDALAQVLQYYRLISYRSFYKKVLGEKIIEKKEDETSNKVRISYRKTEEGEYERDISVDRLYNLNNSLLIVDEAHNLTGNAYGDAVKHIISQSTNLKILLLTATPMKNLADDVVELINLLRPQDDPIIRDKVFNSYVNFEMDFKDGGMDYLRNKIRGYVSHLRGADPLVFATRVDKGIKPPHLLFTKLTSCKMLPFQKKIYDKTASNIDDTLDRRSQAVANFVFPGLSSDKKELDGYFAKEGLAVVRNQLKVHGDLINKKLGIFLNAKDTNGLIYLTNDGKIITGNYLKLQYLQNFSTKFYKALNNLNKLTWGKKGACTAFVYSNLVKIGIELFQQILLINGYLEYQENYNDYQINDDTICYFCGFPKSQHRGTLIIKTKKESKTVPQHDFKPATFVTITGKSSEEAIDMIPEEKIEQLNKVFSNIENYDGKYIKFVLGSKIMNEGISLKNVAEVHILDVYFNLGRVDQVVGRGIRWCSHYGIMSKNNPYPHVNVYKYAVSVENGISTEEELYRKAELKHMLVKKIERIMKEEAIDCPLNVAGNMFNEEIEKYKDCGEGDNEMCPNICDYTKCTYKCSNKSLNDEFYDETARKYKNIKKEHLDTSTFMQSFARNEIDFAKQKIKEMYLFGYVFTLNNIIKHVKNSYNVNKKDLFEEFYVYKALDELIPVSENDFNNFKDTIVDKYNRAGYLIYINKYYIFQPFDQNVNVPMYYRSSFDKNISQTIGLHDYIKNTPEYQKYKTMGESSFSTKNEKKAIIVETYNFDDVMDYYDGRNEYKYVGIIDKEQSRKKSKQIDELIDVFKIREKREKILSKKRGTGIPSLKGAVCNTSKNREYLEKIAKSLDISTDDTITRANICDTIRDKLLYLEKYSTGKNKMTYIMIPKNHPKYPFPYNLEDRIKYTINTIKDHIKLNIDIDVESHKHNSGPLKSLPYYNITIKNPKDLNEFSDFLKSIGAMLVGNMWTIKIE